MKTTFYTTLALVAICMIFAAQGCDHAHDHANDHDGHDHATTAPDGTSKNAGNVQSTQDAHAALHKPKFNNVLVEFPGHKYAMEIIDDDKIPGLVLAILTDAHFTPVTVDAQEVYLNLVVDGNPKTYTLSRIVRSIPKTGEPAAFTLTDTELAQLICEGWRGEATASVEIGGTPYNAKLVKLGGHNHEGHTH